MDVEEKTRGGPGRQRYVLDTRGGVREAGRGRKDGRGPGGAGGWGGCSLTPGGDAQDRNSGDLRLPELGQRPGRGRDAAPRSTRGARAWTKGQRPVGVAFRQTGKGKGGRSLQHFLLPRLRVSTLSA